MFVYNGKLDFGPYAINECITIVFPSGHALNDPVCGYWQWTKDAEGVRARNTNERGAITSVETKGDQYKIAFTLGFYSLDGVVARDLITVTMRDPWRESPPLTLRLQLADPCLVPTARVLSGKLNRPSLATNEMMTLVIPGAIANGEPVGLYWQHTEDVRAGRRRNICVNSTFHSVSTSDGRTTGKFHDGDDTYEATVLGGGKGGKIVMSDSCNTHSDVDVDLGQVDFRQTHIKRALIVRYGTGDDDGIFLVNKMLTDYLGFDYGDVEMLYPASEFSPNASKPEIKPPSGAPTASRFRAKFTDLIASAKAGDVRFLYVDAHGLTYPDADDSGEADGNDEGWKLAEDEGGRRNEVVYDDWVAKTLRENLKPGVNMTILTSSCMGGGMLDTHGPPTPGVLLAGCHETQFNVKAYRFEQGRPKVDPWMFAVYSVIKKRASRKKSIDIPTYAQLFDEARAFIKRKLIDGELAKKYKGPSPDELKPIGYTAADSSSHQDPQLVYSTDYIRPDDTNFKFLCPFVIPHTGHAEGERVRHPKHEAHDEL